MTATVTFQVGDLVKDLTRNTFGRVRRQELGVLILQNRVGYIWRAMPGRCKLVKLAELDSDPLRYPPNTVPLTITPLDVRRGDWVRVEDGNVYQVEDMRAHGAGGRVLHLAGWPRPWVMTPGSRQVYRPT
ncbi:hypothetical protein RND61_11085 [Streptomyces sp. TRM76323]|uniref:Uncharacterized protein n=1 Tax=Streptomyces tamarix TaxID=3078565 RepID=A0ABU3QIL0_9ACTN|nr:hypothetical protein [Streptomyces tamarix]MDT9682607.1 hypothetical protein [Streptomyces tamarix]